MFRIVDADGAISVVKVLDASMVDRTELEARLVVITELADIDARVCRPLPVDGHPAIELTDTDGRHWYAVRYQFAHGRPLEPGNTATQHIHGRRSLPAARVDESPCAGVPSTRRCSANCAA